MKTLFDPQVRADILRRASYLKSDLDRRWGSMTCHQAVCHMLDGLKICFNEIECHSPKGVLNTRFARWFAIDSPLPWPKGKIKSPPVFFTTVPGDFEQDKQTLIDYIARFERGRLQIVGESPYFGKLTPEQWARLNYRHLDHHLAQFQC